MRMSPSDMGPSSSSMGRMESGSSVGSYDYGNKKKGRHYTTAYDESEWKTILALLARRPSPGALRAAMFAASGSTAALDLLIRHGASARVRNDLGDTLLHGAIEAHAVSMLVAHGADVNALNHAGLTPLDAATQAERHEIVATLRRHGGRHSAKWRGVRRELWPKAESNPLVPSGGSYFRSNLK
ncbi:ankyrin repeat domain-containing protein [bacterium]|nr:MAG: ankyrin repeat domain-containing protein [bacterium]